MKAFRIPALILMVTVLMAAWISPARAADPLAEPCLGQVVAVPVYSHIYGGDKETPFYLTVTVSIRNVDPKMAITVDRADYHNSKGRLVQKYAAEPVTLGPLASMRYVIKESDRTGGSGALFIVSWKAEAEALPPIIESVMIGTQLQQGLSFTSRGRVLSENRSR